ncbi:MAG: group II intron reverse transcriptase/maturase, partial [Acidobacteria bacterium]|nr:group II intron reverse transcriptase/maturase [Acidobacteriota bacterium]
MGEPCTWGRVAVRRECLWAEQEKEHRFFDLYHLLYDTDWLRLAHDYVAQNAGSRTAGCDGINMSLFDEKLEENLQQLAQELKSGTYEPYPVRRVYIPKANGRRRALGISSIKDRIVQEALRMILEPIYEADFSQHSYGFRPNRRTMDAISCIQKWTHGRSKYYWIVEGDISSYFDSICHRRLVKILRKRIKDEKIIRLIWKYLRAGVMEGKLFKETELGVPAGGIVSPLLANIYLSQLDRYMEKYTGISGYPRLARRRKREANFLYARFADDFVALCDGTKAQAEALKEELYGFLKGLRLELSREKTKITHLNDGFRFLGFHIKRVRSGKGGMVTKFLIPSEAIRKMLQQIKRATDPSTNRDSVNAKILSLNQLVNGWCQYYQYTSRASLQFKKVEYRLFWCMAHWLGRKFQLTIPQVMKQNRRGNTFATEQYHLRMPHEFPTRIYRECVKKPNPYTKQVVAVEREELYRACEWTGYEDRPGME